MKREDLKKIEGLTDEQINSIMNLHQVDTNTWTTKFNNQNDEIKAERGKVATLTTELDKFKDIDLEALQQAKANYEQEKSKLIADHEEKINALNFDSALEIAVMGANTVDPLALKAHLDRDKLKYNAETKSIDGLDEQMKSIKESYSYLFNGIATGGSHGGLDGNSDSNISLGGALKDHYDR